MVELVHTLSLCTGDPLLKQEPISNLELCSYSHCVTELGLVMPNVANF